MAQMSDTEAKIWNLTMRVRTLTGEVAALEQARNAPLLHSSTSGYILVANNVDVWSDVHPDLASAQEEQAEIVTPTVIYALISLALLEPALAPCTHRRLRQITHALLQCEDCGAELDS